MISDVSKFNDELNNNKSSNNDLIYKIKKYN